MALEVRREDCLTVGDAAVLIGVSRFRMSRLLKQEGITTYRAPDDHRKKWVHWQDIEYLVTPRRRDGAHAQS